MLLVPDRSYAAPDIPSGRIGHVLDRLQRKNLRNRCRRQTVQGGGERRSGTDNNQVEVGPIPLIFNDM